MVSVPAENSFQPNHGMNMQNKNLKLCTIDIWERNKELIRKRTNIGEHFTREVIQSIVFIFYH